MRVIRSETFSVVAAQELQTSLQFLHRKHNDKLIILNLLKIIVDLFDNRYELHQTDVV